MKRIAIFALLLAIPLLLHAQNRTLYTNSETFEGIEITIDEHTVAYTTSFKHRSFKKIEKYPLKNGYIKKSWITDMNGNSEPEVIILIHSSDSDHYKDLEIHELQDKSLKTFELPRLPFTVKDKYRGRDTVKVVNNEIVRFIPLYHKSDDDCCPKGGKATIKYELKSRAIIHSALDLHENLDWNSDDY